MWHSRVVHTDLPFIAALSDQLIDRIQFIDQLKLAKRSAQCKSTDNYLY